MDGYRGRATVDVNALVQQIERLSEIVIRDRTVEEIEINPLFVYKDHCVAIDVAGSCTFAEKSGWGGRISNMK